MSGSYQMIFDPFSGTFQLIRKPAVGLGGGAGTTVTSGVINLPSGSQVECLVELLITPAGGVNVEAGSTLLIL